ncbi:LysR substrate-binding domain-containing protein [Pedobacter heparinus]|uniref:LysR substrate-binding n=1 Tax=Pedobacter heparinus (strain ATCC 13125 / DSM 2366 / CIP 104194 / JCM 7457 / NBRC 12017 / NCIMB 9290 / NRRL B-14731 / HIM 762-3) TaxID=485917 RepID=C6XUT8_PEDHD|nr:LysR substrate-binding domain-containing protein [Pedobacter heparinus]ACU05946.1 LysR substrate-binding [Pedobacter heparinus DSM 2366]
MEIRQINYFIKAAEMLHFTEAAAACFVTQSTLSQQIKQLEEELGMLLFDRVGKHVRLTEAGNVYLKHARQIVLDVKKSKQAILELNNLVTGDLKIGVTYAFSSMLLPALAPFSSKYPGIKIVVEYGTAGELEHNLKQAELDVILAFHDQTDNDNVSLEMEHLFSSRISMVVSKKHPLAGLKKISLNELAKVELILPSKGFSSRDLLNELFRKRKLSPLIKIEMNDVHSLLSMVDEGNWATIINEKAILTWENLIAIPISGKEYYKQAFILWQKGIYRKKSATLFVDELIKTLLG